MLQVHNVDNGKSEWSINETHIIIPMIDADNKESDKILTSTLTLNSLEGEDQAILSNGLEHSLVIGLDKTLFETPNYKSDLVIIQNSDMKNPVAYTLSYVGQDKSEILWQSPIPKDKIFSSDKAILEVRDVLNYDAHELEKTDQINLDGLDSDVATQVTKSEGEILASTVVERKKESHYASYYSGVQNGGSVSILPQLDMTKFIESENPVEDKIFQKKPQSAICSQDLGYGSGESSQGILSNVPKPGIEINNSLPVKLIDDVKSEKKEKIFKNTKAKDEKISENKNKGVSDLLYEESLPLKKKAKMKRTVTLVNSEVQKSMLKQGAIASDQVNNRISVGSKIKQPLATTVLNEEDETRTSESEECITEKVTKRKKSKMKSNPKKCKKSSLDSLLLEEEYETKKPDSNSITEDLPRKTDVCEFDINKFNNIYDLIECLRKCRMINGTVWQILYSGLKEMKIDILKEMNLKKNNECSPESMNYSPQLKAFALVLYFKQPAAFNHLAHVYKAGWPTLNVIKDWKRRMNNHQRPNFVGIERGNP